MVFGQMSEVVGLKQHVAEFGVRKAIGVGNAAFDRVFCQHLIDGDVFADITQKVEHRKLAGPIGVVDQLSLGRALFEVKDAFELALDALHIVVQRLGVKQIALFASTRRVADHAGRPTRECERSVSQQLKSAQGDLSEQMTDVQRIGGGVETDVNAE